MQQHQQYRNSELQLWH